MLAAVSRKAFMSPFHFHRVFRQMTGRRLHEHVRHIRLRFAATSLKLSTRSITQIALDAGYQNHESFSRAFAKQFGLAPRTYREKHATPSKKEDRNMQYLDCSVSIVTVPVSNFKRSTKYYREVLGLEEEFAVDAYGWAQYKTANVPLCLYVTGQGGGDGKPGGDTGIHLKVHNIKSVYEALKRRGASLGSEIVSSDDGGHLFTLLDPDGNRIKVMQG